MVRCELDAAYTRNVAERFDGLTHPDRHDGVETLVDAYAPRLMSVSLTERQVRDRTKTVTRRAGWLMLRVGDQLTLCKKVMGRRPGEPLERIVTVEVTAVRRERLDAITAADVAAEGLEMTPAEFVSFFCGTHHGCRPDTVVGVIEWRYLEGHVAPGALSALNDPGPGTGGQP